MAAQQLIGQAGQLSHAPMLDPMKNPNAPEGVAAALQQVQQSGALPQQPVPA